MAKRKYAKKRASARRSGFSFKRKGKRSSSKNENITGILLAGAAYGAIRAPVAMAADNLLSKLPLPAQIADEATLGVASYFAFKKGKGFIKKLGKAGLYAEAYRVGDTFASPMVAGFMGKITGASANSTTGNIFIN